VIADINDWIDARVPATSTKSMALWWVWCPYLAGTRAKPGSQDSLCSWPGQRVLRCLCLNR